MKTVHAFVNCIFVARISSNLVPRIDIRISYESTVLLFSSVPYADVLLVGFPCFITRTTLFDASRDSNSRQLYFIECTGRRSNFVEYISSVPFHPFISLSPDLFLYSDEERLSLNGEKRARTFADACTVLVDIMRFDEHRAWERLARSRQIVGRLSLY